MYSILIVWIYVPFQVDINGHCTFSDQLVYSQFFPRPLQSIQLPRVAPFWVDLDVRAGGNVFYRVLVNGSTDEAQAILASISRQSSAVLFPDIKFNAKWALLVTWNRVPFLRDSGRVRQWANIAYEAPHSESWNVPLCMCASVNSWWVDKQHNQCKLSTRDNEQFM